MKDMRREGRQHLSLPVWIVRDFPLKEVDPCGILRARKSKSLDLLEIAFPQARDEFAS